MKLRTFIAVDIGPLPKILELAERLKASGADLKLVEPENIHITLKFLGDTDSGLMDQIADIIAESSADIEPFYLNLEEIGAFPKLTYMKVIWVGIAGGEGLVTVSERLDRALKPLGFKSEKKGFKPHLTIARVRSPRNKNELLRVIDAHKEESFGEVQVDSIVLKKSVLSPSGPTYTDLKEIKLAGGE